MQRSVGEEQMNLFSSCYFDLFIDGKSTYGEARYMALTGKSRNVDKKDQLSSDQ